MKSVLFVALIALSFTAHSAVATASQAEDVVSAKKGKSKSEPAPKDRDERDGGGEEVDPRQETYEGNDRSEGGGYFDGGGYNDGGGMIGEIFTVPSGKTYPVTTNVKKEDRGDVIVYTTTVQEDISASETCTTIVTTVVDKVTGKAISSDSNEFCNRWPL